MTQYAASDFDSKSQRSMNSSNKFNASQEISSRIQSKEGSGFELPEPGKPQRNRSSGNTTVNSEKYVHSESNSSNSLVRAGKLLME